MKLLLDTRILLWAAQHSPRLSNRTRGLLSDPQLTVDTQIMQYRPDGAAIMVA